MFEITNKVEELRKSLQWKNYLQARDMVGVMMDKYTGDSTAFRPSDYWQQEILGFDYLFDASPLIINKLREHCYHVTGIKSYEYRNHHLHLMKNFQWKLDRLNALNKTNLFVPESDILGGFGFNLSSGLVNIDTLKFYEVMIGLDQVGFLEPFLEPRSKSVILEIGSGWGGYAYTFKKLFPSSTYICIDLPQTLLFSITYLTTAFPNSKCLYYGEEGFDLKFINHENYDFIFLPNYCFDKIKQIKIDLGVNMVSFQEMTSFQVDWYVKTLKDCYICPRVYSLNRDRSKHNNQLSSVSEILSEHYNVNIVNLLDLQYVNLKPNKSISVSQDNTFSYQHLAGLLQ